MTSASATTPRNCPVCGSRNSGLSLFCAECGAALNGSSETDTTAFETTRPEESSQRTQAFAPSSSSPADSERWQPPESTSTQALPSSRNTGAFPWSQAVSEPSGAADGGWSSPVGTAAVRPSQPDEGIRGFVLGALAILLIVALLGLYLWAGVLSDNTRDTVSGWFDFIGN